MKNYYNELPENFTMFKCIDAKDDKKVVIIFQLISILLMVVGFVVFLPALSIDFENLNHLHLVLVLFLFLLFYIIYIVLHELTHGIAYKILTKQKLTFGLTLTVAFCGVPHIYVNKKTALISVLAPFVVYSLIFIPLIFIVPNGVFRLIPMLIFACHFGGCIGDLWVTFVLLCKKGEVLMNDTGPKQTFYCINKGSVKKSM